MFTRTDLAAIEHSKLIHWTFSGCYPGLHFTTYPQHAFRAPCSEELIRITRAPRLTADNGLRFWCSAERTDDWSTREHYFAPYLHGAEFEPISEETFNRMVMESSSELVAPLPLPLHPPTGFVGALLMYSMRTDFTVSVLAEYEDEFIHYFWTTSA